MISFRVRVMVTRPVWFNVRGLREVLKTNNVTERRNGHLRRCRLTKPLFLGNVLNC
jgi:hypothetical protein